MYRYCSLALRSTLHPRFRVRLHRQWRARRGTFLKAIDIQTGKTKWEISGVGGGVLGSGLLSTAGGLIFYGDGRGAFIGADASNGRPLWHFNTGQNWKAGLMIFMVDGRQRVGVAAGSLILAFGLP